jgi:predicted anti-sigma-YlaC factor YlaD
MTSDACREMRAALGAAALGRLEPAEEVALTAHLEGCASCRAEWRQLESVARALPLADPAHLSKGLPQPPRELGDLVSSRVAHERSARRTRTRGRVVLAAAAAIVAVLAVLALVVVPGSGSSGTAVAFPAHDGVSASATLHDAPAGTEVSLRVTGLHDGDAYWLWLTGDDGDRIGAGTFNGAKSPLSMKMTAAIPLSATRRIWVTDANDEVVLDARLDTRS